MPSKIRSIFAFALTCLGLAGPALAEHPAGAVVRLNATTAGDQRLTDVGTTREGRFVAVWWSHTSAAAPWLITARVFDSTLAPLTPEILVTIVPNEYGAFSGRVGVDPKSGDFVVVWSTHDSVGLPTGLFARRFSAAGASLGPILSLAPAGSGSGYPDVARVGPNFVVVWQRFDAASTPASPSFDIVGRRFSASGAPLGPVFPVVVAAGTQEYPEIAMNASGRFAVAFEHLAGEHVALGIWSPLAVPLVAPFIVSGSGQEEGLALAMANDGRIFIEWSNNGIDPPDAFGHGWGVVGRELAANGATLLGPGRVNVFLDEIQAALTAAAKADGGFLAGWVSYTQDGSGTGVYGREILPVIGPEFRVNVATPLNQFDLRFGTFGDGRGVAAYSTVLTGYDVVARKLVP
jgi:hypothetical protein